ncbi:MAG: alpha/beta fold hydrolase [Desulfovibrionaceae bacterium]
MPLLKASYTAPFWLRNGHVQTLWPVLFRPKVAVSYRRQRIDTPDGDFIDLDMLSSPPTGTAPRRVVILSHGLEGNSRRTYMTGMARMCHAHGWDVIARHMRACSEDMNRTRGITHMGDTDDIHTTVLHACALGYSQIALVGFSMGGNQSLNYISESPCRMPTAVRACVAVSVPCDLVSAVEVLSLPSRRLYMEYFLCTLRQKMRVKAQQFPDFPSVAHLARMRTFAEFDGQFTAPVHGFSSALEYWTRASCAPHLHRISIPTLLINAADDPFLTAPCYPVETARTHPLLHLEIPAHGGHVGFVTRNRTNSYWTEQRVVDFLREALPPHEC